MNKDSKNETETDGSNETQTSVAEPVPFFARQLGRPALVVKTGIRAGAPEQQQKSR